MFISVQFSSKLRWSSAKLWQRWLSAWWVWVSLFFLLVFRIKDGKGLQPPEVAGRHKCIHDMYSKLHPVEVSQTEFIKLFSIT